MNWYCRVGDVLGMIVAVTTFFITWIWCMSAYGFLLGFGLGWIPSAMLAGMLALTVRYMWGPVAVGLGILIIAVSQ